MVFTNPLTYIRSLWGGQERTTVPFPENDETAILDVPVEIRLEIWKYLIPKEQTALRRVCTIFHHDVTQFLGVYTELTGHKPWSQWTLDDQKRCIFSLRNTNIAGNPEPSRFLENWDWISNLQVQSLSVRGLGRMPAYPGCPKLVRNGHSMRRLVIELDENIRPNGVLPSLLIAFKNLRILNVSWELAALFKPKPTALEEYRQNSIFVTREILKSLVGRHALRELCVEVDIPLGKEHAVQTFLGVVNDPTTAQKLDYPTRIEKLKLVFPIMQAVDRPEIPGWRALLDRQTQLRHLTFDLGFVYWPMFRSALTRNAQTIEELDLTLSNWFIQRSEENWNRTIHPDFCFNWRALTENAVHLKLLRVVMSRSGIFPEPTPHKTTNFDELNLLHLERLELQSVHLTRDHFEKIFHRLPNLKKVKLIHWHDLRQGNRSEAATSSLGPVLHVLLRSNQLEEIKLLDWCILDCPKPVYKLLRVVPNYDVKFPICILGRAFSVDDSTLLPEMLITLKPANQLAPPIFA